jgi:hypothetical protein
MRSGYLHIVGSGALPRGLHPYSTGGFGVAGSRPPPKLPGNHEGEKVNGILGIVTLFVAGGILPLAKTETRPAEKALIKVPFAFVIGN